MSLLFILVYALRLFFAIFVESRDAEVMFEEISSHQNVVVINRFSHIYDWKNIMRLDVTLKNDVRMIISCCERGENNDIVYENVCTVNDWVLWKAVHYEDSGRYRFSLRKRHSRGAYGKFAWIFVGQLSNAV